MKNFVTRALVLVCLFLSVQSHAQDLIKGSPGLYPALVSFKASPQNFTAGKVILADETGKATATASGTLINKHADNLGMEHYRYQQSYAGIPVELSTYIVHVQAGKVMAQNGVWVKDFPSGLKTTAAINASTALQKAMNHVGAQTYKWQIPAEEAFIKREQNNPNATFFPKAELVYYSGEQEVTPSALRLAYKLDIYAHYPMSRQVVFVDAQNGSILGERELIHATNATGTAITVYSGTQTITTDFTGSTYRLRETGRGNGINTLNMKNAGTSYAAAVDFTDADNTWNNVNANKDEYATDGHWGTEKTYDYYFTKHNRNSVDNAGLALNSYIHANLVAFGYPDNVNAFWDGSRMTYGDGGSGVSPLTAIDITGHEITHGVTERSSNLIYSNESGAMNEALSDIFGTAVEFYAKPGSANWTMGENIGLIIRSMSNPNAYSDPDTYRGTFWYTGTGDNGGVHTNSGVLNFWFYLLTNGGSGTNDVGTAYSVTGIGIDKAAAIAYRMNTVYFTSTSNYAAARTFGIRAAEDLFGVGSVEATQTSCAFAAVGIGTCGTAPTCAAPAGLISSSITTSGATVSWTAVSGAVSYAVDYKAASSTTWISAATATTSTSVALSGLTSSTLYDWRVRTNCSSSNSAYTQAQFTTTGTGGGCSTAFEPNETQATAATITSGVANSAAISSTTDVDYFKITTTATSNNNFALAGPAGVDYDMYIYNSAGTQIGTGTGATATENVTLSSQAAGTYYIRIIGYNGANSATCYTLTATATTVTSCQSSLDNATNGTISGAATIPFNTNVTGLISPSGDIDNYKFVITVGGTATVTLTTLPGDYDLKILNSAGTQLAISQAGGTTGESIARTYTAGTYYAQVYGYNGANNATSCYTLRVALGTASVTGEAAQLVSGETKVFPNPASNVLNISIPGVVNPKSTAQVMDVNGKAVLTQSISSNQETINISNLPKGVYMLRIKNGGKETVSRFSKQ